LGEIDQEIPWVHEEERENTFSFLTERRGYKEVSSRRESGPERRRRKKGTGAGEIVAELVFS
jgi:hypothetical protein